MKRSLFFLIATFLIFPPISIHADDDTESFLDDLHWKAGILKNATVLRIGGGAFDIQDNELDQYNRDGYAVMGDVFFYRYRPSDWQRRSRGFDLYTRFTYRNFSWSDDDPSASPLSLRKFEAAMFSADLGIRVLVGGFFLGELWQAYALAAPRYLIYSEKATLQNDTEQQNSFSAIGIVGGVGIEMTLFRHMALFVEYNNGYTPVGDSRKNVEGNTILWGIAVRLPL